MEKSPITTLILINGKGELVYKDNTNKEIVGIDGFMDKVNCLFFYTENHLKL